MTSKWTVAALLFSVAVNVAAVGTLVYFRQADRRPDRLRIFSDRFQPKPDFVWLSDGQIEPESLRKRIEMRRQYREQLYDIRRTIDQRRNAIVLQLQKEPVDRDSLNLLLERLSADQIRAERLTVDHLLALKPVLPGTEWRRIIHELEAPPHMMRILPFDRDSTLRQFMREPTIKELKIRKHRK